MDFSERIAELSKKVKNLGDSLKTEEATKNALVMPFIAALGYDVFNPAEVVPEFSAPIGEYKDARVDYAILVDGKPILLLECKALGTSLDMKHCNQLQLLILKQPRKWTASPIWSSSLTIWTKCCSRNCANWQRASLIGMPA